MNGDEVSREQAREAKGWATCVLIDCGRAPEDGVVGNPCTPHKRQIEAMTAGVQEPALERKLTSLPTPPPSVVYEPDPDYRPPADQPASGYRQQQATTAPEADLAYLSDALEGRLGAIKAAQASVLLQLVCGALRTL